MSYQDSTDEADPILGKVNVSAAEGIGWIELDNPTRRNAISSSMWSALVAALADFGDRAEIRCVVFSGKGTVAFCAGADLHEKACAASLSGPDQDRLILESLNYIQMFRKPVIAMVSGFCLGAGVALAAACDLRIGSTDAQFAIPTAKLGLAAHQSFVSRLVRLIGPSGTKRLLFTAERVLAAEALRLGLLDEIVPALGLLAKVRALAGLIVANAPLSIEAAKYAVETAIGNAKNTDLEACAFRERLCLDSTDYLEGRRAFLEKRTPSFRGG